MAECFCGCGRRVRFRGRTANVYGYNAKMFAEHIQGVLEAGWSEDELEDNLVTTTFGLEALLHSLEMFRDGYRDVVHGDKSLSQMSYPLWVSSRKDAQRITMAANALIQADPERRRRAALGRWGIENQLTEEEAVERLAAMNSDEMAEIIRRYG